jgi:hypothetical protein
MKRFRLVQQNQDWVLYLLNAEQDGAPIIALNEAELDELSWLLEARDKQRRARDHQLALGPASLAPPSPLDGTV